MKVGKLFAEFSADLLHSIDSATMSEIFSGCGAGFSIQRLVARSPKRGGSRLAYFASAGTLVSGDASPLNHTYPVGQIRMGSRDRRIQLSHYPRMREPALPAALYH